MFVGAFGAGATAASASGVRGDTHAKFPVMRRFLANTKVWLWPRRSPAAATLNSAARSWISLRPLFPREPRRGQSNALNGIAKRYRSSSGPCPVAVGGGRGRLLDGHRVGRRKVSLRASSSAFSQRALARLASAIHVMRFAFHLRYHVHFAPSRRTRSGDDRHARLLFGFLPRARNAWQL